MQATTIVKNFDTKEPLKDQVAVVTGASNGLGATIAQKFAESGANVLIVDVDDRGQAVAEKSDKLHFIKGSVSEKSTWEKVRDETFSKFGRIDIVVNNAGRTFNPAKVHELPMSLYDSVFDLNVRPIFISAQVMAPTMVKQGNGCFINISSASKSAVTTATKTFALEYAPTLRFNCIAPALANTSMLQTSLGNNPDPEKLKSMTSSIPMARVTEPEDVAQGALYLATAPFVTGVLLPVDGGRGV